jgi:hypothetical protein
MTTSSCVAPKQTKFRNEQKSTKQGYPSRNNSKQIEKNPRESVPTRHLSTTRHKLTCLLGMENNPELESKTGNEFIWCAKVNKIHANDVRKKARLLNIQGPSPLITQEEFILIPLLRSVTESEMKELQRSEERIPVEVVQHMLPFKILSPNPFEKVAHILQYEHDFPPELVPLLPKKWEKVGHVLILKKLDPKVKPFEKYLAEALHNSISGAGTCAYMAILMTNRHNCCG